MKGCIIVSDIAPLCDAGAIDPQEFPTPAYLVTKQYAAIVRAQRPKFAHKGLFGHALIVGGSYGKIGAAVLASKACLRAGTGLLTIHVPSCGIPILQTAVPEAMVDADDNERLTSSLYTELNSYDAIGAGPGIGTAPETQRVLHRLVTTTTSPLVLDADALNILSGNKEWIKQMPANTILTPHAREFDRLVEQSFASGFERVSVAREFAMQHQLIVVLKGAHTATCSPSGEVFFNTSGNPGMATAGSGDVLTGIITGLLAQKYVPLEAALLGVFIHGRAGDQAALTYGQDALIASDIIENLR